MELKMIVIGLAVIYVMTFLGGFLQATQFNFLNYIFFFLLFVGGIMLMVETGKSDEALVTKGVLFLIGICTTVLFTFGAGYEWARLTDRGDLERSIEAFLYLTTLFFWIGVVASLVMIGRFGSAPS